MEIEKFLEKISQDERVEKITYSKERGYFLTFNKGYGILKKEVQSVWCNNFCVGSFLKNKTISFEIKSNQNQIKRLLERAEKLNENELEKENEINRMECLKSEYNGLKYELNCLKNKEKKLKERIESISKMIDTTKNKEE